MIKIALVSVAPLQHDSRVLRHAALLSKAGYAVRIFAQAPLPAMPTAPVTVIPGPGSDARVRVGMMLRQAPASVLPASAETLFWLSQSRWVARRDVLRFRPDIVIANDWRALPIASAAKRSFGARILYDSHEFASEEFLDSRRWRWFARSHVAEIERRLIKEADAVTTVSAGIADALAQLYDLPRPTVISNTPPRQSTSFKPTRAEHITVLYHGAVVPRRGLDILVESVAFWPEHFRLVIRGPAQGGYDRHLHRLAKELGNRIVFDPAVAPDQVVAAASEADIGIFLLSNSTVHARFAMPNKIFEYMQAGLMVISSDLPEIRTILEQTNCGSLLKDLSVESITSIISKLEEKNIDIHKQNSLTAAKSMNFDNEGTKLMSIISNLIDFI
jgi:glycosyltransferase involved in cell wall biosynthesis